MKWKKKPGSKETIYRRGARKEYKVMQKLRSEGWYCVRNAGSHGLWDITAFHPGKKEIKIIQVKNGKIGSAAIEKIKNELSYYIGNYHCDSEVISDD